MIDRGSGTEAPLDDATEAEVRALLADVSRDRGFWPLSDQLDADLGDRTSDPAERPLSIVHRAAPSGHVDGYAQASRRAGGWTMQTVVASPDADRAVERRLVAAIVDAVDGLDGGEIDWWIYDPDPAAADTASASGFEFDRDLLQLRRPLPADRRAGIATRSFRVGQDEQAWLTVNNRAFSGHAEQGSWTLDTLRQRMAQPWFDAEGIRLHERDGRLAGSCWTKIHDPARLAEIYVIAVDPDFQGLGLGKELTLAGLDHMSDRGITDAMLYVDGHNATARRLYERLGFVVHRTDRAFRRASSVTE